MPWAAYDETGRLQIGFFDRSYDPANHTYGYTLANEKSPGQLNFSFQQVTTTLSDPTQGDRWFGVTVNPAFPNATRFLGDYSGIATVPGQQVATLWTDMRNSVTFGRTGSGQDAYFALVKANPGNGSQGATAAGSGISTTGAASGLVSATIINPLINSNQVPSTGTALGGAIENSVVNGNAANGSVPGEGGWVNASNGVLTLLASNVKGKKSTTDFDAIFEAL